MIQSVEELDRFLKIKQMKLKGRIFIGIGIDSTKIEITDDSSRIRFCEITLTPEQLSAALSRQADTPCILEIKRLELVGKKHEHKSFQFELPKSIDKYSDSFKGELWEYGQNLVDKEYNGWVLDKYFGSQNTFFTLDGKDMVRATARRWV